jgi:hypothetical protein
MNVDLFEDLIETIEKKIDDPSCKNIMQMLVLSSVEHDCNSIRRILTDSSYDVHVLIEIFLTRSNQQIELIDHTYVKRMQPLFIFVAVDHVRW